MLEMPMLLIEPLITLDAAAETLTIDVSNELPRGKTTLKFEYTGILNDQMRGFYRSKYCHPDHPDEERYAAVTQFEPVDARRALPCWDEPAHKATFDVSLVVPKERVALSNMVGEKITCLKWALTTNHEL